MPQKHSMVLIIKTIFVTLHKNKKVKISIEMEQYTNENLTLESIYTSIESNGFTYYTLEKIDQYTQEILNGKTNLIQFNQQEHAGLCCAGEVLIGAYIVCNYARKCLEASSDTSTSERIPSNWEIDELQEKLVQQWAEAKQIWFANAEYDIESEYGPIIAQGAEAKVYYKTGDSSVIKLRTSIYATLSKALEAIVLHNALFPETQMNVIGFMRDSDELFRFILTQPYVGCKRLATKQEIDILVGNLGFEDNWNGEGINYKSSRLSLEDMHPANVFIDTISDKAICIDCIVKFIRK